MIIIIKVLSMCTNVFDEMLKFLKVWDKMALVNCCRMLKKTIPIDTTFDDSYDIKFDGSKSDLKEKITHLYNKDLKQFQHIEFDNPNLQYLTHHQHDNLMINKIIDSNLTNVTLLTLWNPTIDTLLNTKWMTFIERLKPTKVVFKGQIIFPISKLHNDNQVYNILNVIIQGLSSSSNSIKQIEFDNAYYDEMLFNSNKKGNNNNDIKAIRIPNNLNCLKVENTSWFIMEVILNQISLTNLTTMCIDATNFGNNIKSRNWATSGIILYNLVEFCFTDSVHVARNYNDIGKDLITYILIKHQTQLQKIGINQGDATEITGSPIQQIRNRFCIYNKILSKMSQLRTIQYSRGVIEYNKGNVYHESIFEWFIHFINNMSMKQLFCLSFCVFDDGTGNDMEDNKTFERLFGKYLRRLTYSLKIKTNGAYFITAQIRQDHADFYELDPNIVSTDDYSIYDEFGTQITDEYEVRASWYSQSQGITLFGPNIPHNIYMQDYRIQNDFSWNKRLYESKFQEYEY